MNRNRLVNLINYILITYLVVWIYYAVFNWDIFTIQLNTNAGFSVIKGYPFVFFFVLGLVILIVLKYFIQLNKADTEKSEKDKLHKIALQAKDIELLKMKEVLLKMQTSEMDKNSSNLRSLHEKLDNLSKHASESDNDTETEENSTDIEKE